MTEQERKLIIETQEPFVHKCFCEERHRNLDRCLENIDRNVEKLCVRINWFYLIAIITLATAVGALAVK